MYLCLKAVTKRWFLLFNQYCRGVEKKTKIYRLKTNIYSINPETEEALADLKKLGHQIFLENIYETPFSRMHNKI